MLNPIVYGPAHCPKAHVSQPELFGCTSHWAAFLSRRKGASETLTPEDIEVDWLGGYWKLPSADMTPGWLAWSSSRN